MEIGCPMSRKKHLLLATITLIITLVASATLCACLPKATKSQSILLTDNYNDINVSIGDFELASMRNDSYARQFEVRVQDKENFIKFLKSSEYYIGTFALSADNYYLSKKNRCKVFNGGDECIWFAYKGNMWIGKFYANKFFYLAYMPLTMLSNDDFFIKLPEAIFSDENPKKVGEEYVCSLTWEQLKSVYSEHNIDEQNCSIEINCFIYYTDEHPNEMYGVTFLYYNKENNTVKVSNDYTLLDVQ